MNDCIRDRILIVDEDEIILETLSIALEARGFRVITRSRSIGTGALILTERPEIAILDIQMPGLPGDALVSLLENKKGFPMPWIVFHSSLPEDELQRIAHSKRAAGAIPKGDVRTFMSAFETLLMKLRREDSRAANGR